MEESNDAHSSDPLRPRSIAAERGREHVRSSAGALLSGDRDGAATPTAAAGSSPGAAPTAVSAPPPHNRAESACSSGLSSLSPAYGPQRPTSTVSGAAPSPRTAAASPIALAGAAAVPTRPHAPVTVPDTATPTATPTSAPGSATPRLHGAAPSPSAASSAAAGPAAAPQPPRHRERSGSSASTASTASIASAATSLASTPGAGPAPQPGAAEAKSRVPAAPKDSTPKPCSASPAAEPERALELPPLVLGRVAITARAVTPVFTASRPAGATPVPAQRRLFDGRGLPTAPGATPEFVSAIGGACDSPLRAHFRSPLAGFRAVAPALAAREDEEEASAKQALQALLPAAGPGRADERKDSSATATAREPPALAPVKPDLQRSVIGIAVGRPAIAAACARAVVRPKPDAPRRSRGLQSPSAADGRLKDPNPLTQSPMARASGALPHVTRGNAARQSEPPPALVLPVALSRTEQILHCVPSAPAVTIPSGEERKEVVEAKGGVPDGQHKGSFDAVAPPLSRNDKRSAGRPNDAARGREKRFSQSSHFHLNPLHPMSRDPRINSLSETALQQQHEHAHATAIKTISVDKNEEVVVTTATERVRLSVVHRSKIVPVWELWREANLAEVSPSGGWLLLSAHDARGAVEIYQFTETAAGARLRLRRRAVFDASAKHVVTAACWRKDGYMFAIGTSDGFVHAFQIDPRALQKPERENKLLLRPTTGEADPATAAPMTTIAPAALPGDQIGAAVAPAPSTGGSKAATAAAAAATSSAPDNPNTVPALKWWERINGDEVLAEDGVALTCSARIGGANEQCTALQFSPDGSGLLAAVGTSVVVWRRPHRDGNTQHSEPQRLDLPPAQWPKVRWLNPNALVGLAGGRIYARAAVAARFAFCEWTGVKFMATNDRGVIIGITETQIRGWCNGETREWELCKYARGKMKANDIASVAVSCEHVWIGMRNGGLSVFPFQSPNTELYLHPFPKPAFAMEPNESTEMDVAPPPQFPPIAWPAPMACSAPAQDPTDKKFRDAIRAAHPKWQLEEESNDGNCLYRAVAHQMYGTPEAHLRVRDEAYTYMEANREFFSNYITSDFDEYVMRNRAAGQWADHVEIYALSALYKRQIDIFDAQHVATPRADIKPAVDPQKTPIRLTYHGLNHFNSLLDCVVPLPLADEKELNTGYPVRGTHAPPKQAQDLPLPQPVPTDGKESFRPVKSVCGGDDDGGSGSVPVVYVKSARKSECLAHDRSCTASIATDSAGPRSQHRRVRWEGAPTASTAASAAAGLTSAETEELQIAMAMSLSEAETSNSAPPPTAAPEGQPRPIAAQALSEAPHGHAQANSNDPQSDPVPVPLQSAPQRPAAQPATQPAADVGGAAPAPLPAHAETSAAETATGDRKPVGAARDAPPAAAIVATAAPAPVAERPLPAPPPAPPA